MVSNIKEDGEILDVDCKDILMNNIFYTENSRISTISVYNEYNLSLYISTLTLTRRLRLVV